MPELPVVPGLVWSSRGFFRARKKKGTVLSAAWDQTAEIQSRLQDWEACGCENRVAGLVKGELSALQDKLFYLGLHGGLGSELG